MKTIFLGYPFAIPEIRVAVEAGCEGIARVLVASDRLRGKHLLVKIDEMIAEADLSLFDLTLHNPNVAVEFGLAYVRNAKWAILYSTDAKYKVVESIESRIFSDLEGMDSIRYPDFGTLTTELRRLLPEYLSAPHVGLRSTQSIGGLSKGGLAPEQKLSMDAQRRHEESLMPLVSMRLDCAGKRGVLVPEITIRGAALNSGLGPATAVYLHIATVSYIPSHAIHIGDIGSKTEFSIDLKFPLSATAQPLDSVPYTCVTRYKDIFGNEGATAQRSFSGFSKDMTEIGRILPAPNTAEKIEKLLDENHVPKGLVQ